MHGGEVVEDQQLLAILDQAVDRLGILRFVGLDVAIERLLRLMTRLCSHLRTSRSTRC